MAPDEQQRIGEMAGETEWSTSATLSYITLRRDGAMLGCQDRGADGTEA